MLASVVNGTLCSFGLAYSKSELKGLPLNMHTPYTPDNVSLCPFMYVIYWLCFGYFKLGYINIHSLRAWFCADTFFGHIPESVCDILLLILYNFRLQGKDGR